MCQELVELEMGEGGQREKTLEMLAMGTVWEEYGGLFVYIRNGGGSDTVLAPGAEAGGQEEEFSKLETCSQMWTLSYPREATWDEGGNGKHGRLCPDPTGPHCPSGALGRYFTAL